MRSVFHDLFPEDEAAEREMRSLLLAALQRWLAKANITQEKAANELGITPARVLDIKQGKLSRLSLDLLVRMAVRAGLRPRIELAAT